MIKVVCLESGNFSTMIKNENNIPAGYKDSAVGIIPQEWEVKTLGELVSITSGESPSSYVLSERGKYPFVKVEDMNNCIKFQNCSREYTNEEKHIVKRGSIIFPKRGAAISNNKVRIAGCNMYMDSNMMAIFPNNTVDSVFLYYKITNEQLYRIADTSTIPQINNKHIIPYKICLPSFAEQRQIVNIIGTWDEAIEKQTKLIKALEKRKQALMQRLLSGRTRLPGFTGEWKKEKLMDIGIFLSTNNFPRDKMNETEGTIMNVHYGDILIKYPTIVDLKTINVPYLNNGIKVKSDLLKDGDVIIADTAEDKIVGKAIEIVNIGTHQIVSGLHTFAFRPNESLFVNRFLGYYLNSVGYRKQLESLIQGIKVCSISKSSILNTYISIPLIKEQQAIVNILVSADDEIKRHNTKLSQLRKQKRGLMQQLLTGKKRVRL